MTAVSNIHAHKRLSEKPGKLRACFDRETARTGPGETWGGGGGGRMSRLGIDGYDHKKSDTSVYTG